MSLSGKPEGGGKGVEVGQAVGNFRIAVFPVEQEGGPDSRGPRALDVVLGRVADHRGVGWSDAKALQDRLEDRRVRLRPAERARSEHRVDLQPVVRNELVEIATSVRDEPELEPVPTQLVQHRQRVLVELEVLRSVFRETWRALIQTIKSVEEGDDPPREQLRKVAEILLRSWRRDPDLVRVLVLEVTRSGHLAGEMDEIVASFAAIQEIVERGQADGSIRADLDARLASYVFYGAIDELLTGWVLGRLRTRMTMSRAPNAPWSRS